MSANLELAAMFHRMAQVLELTEANKFRVIAYQRAAAALEELARDVKDIGPDLKALQEIDGIGKGMAEKIAEYLRTGKVVEHNQLLASVPKGVLEMMNIPGVGPKTAALLWKQGRVQSIEQLKAKLQTGELEDLPRMGKKTLQNIAKSIDFTEKAGQRARIGEALPAARYFVEQLRRIKGVKEVDYAGSLRRGRETIGDIDLLLACNENDAPRISESFRKLPGVKEVLAAGPTKSSVRIEAGTQVDLRVVRPDRYGAALMYFTGSKEHNVALRERAIKMGFRLNEYGLWKAADADRQDEAEPVAAKTEQDIYKKLKLPWIPQEIREDRGEIAAAEREELPQLITLEDVRCELHAHTRASDGHMSIEELASVAKDRGFHTIAVTDHSGSQIQANGLNAKRLEQHIEAIHDAAQRVKGITILAGSEVDILSDGKLDYPNSLLKELDVVVASPHAALSQDSAKATKRLHKAIDNSYVHIIGHATGRLINRREGLSPNMTELFKAAADNGTAFEINANPWRLDLRDTHARAAVEAGVMLAINTDAHSPGDFGLLIYGILTARRAWVQPENVVNCMTAQKLQTWLKAKRS